MKTKYNSKCLFLIIIGLTINIIACHKDKAGNTVRDIDGNVYHTVTIGTQTWMVENLKTTRLHTGKELPKIEDPVHWANATQAGFCWYNNDEANKKEHGALYNWYAVETGLLAPKGWHVATAQEWNTLAEYLGGAQTAGGKMKETGTLHWNNPNKDATNESGFTALASGCRGDNSVFREFGYWGAFWTSSGTSELTATGLSIAYDSAQLETYSSFQKYKGFSVRCIKD